MRVVHKLLRSGLLSKLTCQECNKVGLSKAVLRIRGAYPGSLFLIKPWSRLPDPGSRILDQTIATKEGNFFYLFCSSKFDKIVNYFSSGTWYRTCTEFFFCQFTKIAPGFSLFMQIQIQLSTFDADPDPDPAFYLEADPHPASQKDADSDPVNLLRNNWFLIVINPVFRYVLGCSQVVS